MGPGAATGRGYMTFAGGFAEANVAEPEAIAKHVFAVVRFKFASIFTLF